MTTASAERDDWYDRLDDPSSERRVRVILRWLPILLGLIVFELTADPILGVVLGCIRFGERDIVTAWWILRRDDRRVRAWSCASFHVAWAFLQIGCAAVSVIVFITVALVLFGQLPAVIMAQGKGAILSVCAAALGFLGVAYLAIGLALAGGVRAWVASTNHIARAARQWPPVVEGKVITGRNRVGSLIAFAAVATFTIGGGVAELCINWNRPRGGPIELSTGQTIGLLVVLFVLLALTIKLALRLSARRPIDCWPEADGTRS